MKIKIAHLYYDLLNLYGEEGNILALTNALNNQNISYKLDQLSIGDNIKFLEYDIIYLGCGSEESIALVLSDILKYKSTINKAIEKGICFIATGNAHELFGQSLEIKEEQVDGLKLMPYFSKSNNQRIVGESIMSYGSLSPIIGFQNRKNVIQIKENHLFKKIQGYADNFKSGFEGYKYLNFYGTYLIGPLLIRNPHFTDYIIESIFHKKKISYTPILDTYEYKAYYEYLKNFYDQNGQLQK